jgi:2-keto-4-pentenoate hydratase/2-oxohepta-3-ene-1,7-dioic acid hydratase in catechol pathway
MTLWIRYDHAGRTGFGTLEGTAVAVHEGSPFDDPRPTGATLDLADVTLRRPCEPTKMVALWNNFRALAAKLKQPVPPEPLYFLKNPASFADPGAIIRRPASYDGKVVYEGELGIVIGRTVQDASDAEAEAAIFGYTCVNDVTAADVLARDPTFAQWTRAKGYAGFGPFGPAIATGLDPATLVVRTVLDGAERQSYPIADMVFPAAELVARISRDMPLLPGDIISCGTSVGVGSMKGPVNEVSVAVEGIGSLSNRYEG